MTDEKKRRFAAMAVLEAIGSEYSFDPDDISLGFGYYVSRDDLNRFCKEDIVEIYKRCGSRIAFPVSRHVSMNAYEPGQLIIDDLLRLDVNIPGWVRTNQDLYDVSMKLFEIEISRLRAYHSEQKRNDHR